MGWNEEEFDMHEMLLKHGQSINCVRKMKYECLCPGCHRKAVNSHLLQRHPFIASICENNEVFQICDNEINPMSGDFDFSKPKIVGIQEALSLPLFCSEHDNGIFKPVEKANSILSDLSNQHLLSYRALCAQWHLERKRLALYKENNFHGSAFDAMQAISEYTVSRFMATANEMWQDIHSNNFSSYQFSILKLPRIPLCISDAIIDEEQDCEDLAGDDSKIPFNVLYVHLIPFEDSSKLIIGYNSKHVSNQQKEYYDSWLKEQDDYAKAIWGLWIRVKNWCCSPSLIKDIDSFVEQMEIDRIDIVMGNGGC